MRKVARDSRIVKKLLAMAGVFLCSCFLLPVSAKSEEIHTVEMMSSNSFSPASITIQAGDSVKFVNKGGVHTAQSDGEFDTGDMSQGSEKTVGPFLTAKTISYYCKYHQDTIYNPPTGMRGSITIQGTPPPQQTTPPPPPPATTSPTTKASPSPSPSPSPTQSPSPEPTESPTEGTPPESPSQEVTGSPITAVASDEGGGISGGVIAAIVGLIIAAAAGGGLWWMRRREG